MPEIGLILRIVIWMFGAIVVIASTVFLVVDAMDKAESIQARWPWTTEVLDAKSRICGAASNRRGSTNWRWIRIANNGITGGIPDPRDCL